MDLEPFNRINPCGYAGLEMTQMKDLSNKPLDIHQIGQQIVQQFKMQFFS